MTIILLFSSVVSLKNVPQGGQRRLMFFEKYVF